MKKNSGILATLLLVMTFAGCAGSKKAAPRNDDVYGVRAYGYFIDGDFKRSIEAYKAGFAAARRDDNGLGAARYLSNIGRVYYELGQADSAALYFAKAREEFFVYGDKNEALKTAAWLALSFASAGDEVSARKWLALGAVPLFAANTGKKERMGEEHYYIVVIMGMIDFRLTSKISDETMLDAAYVFYRKKKNHSAVATINILRADVELSRNNCTTAARYLNSALANIDTSREKYRRSGALLKLAAASFCTGDEKLGKHYYERARDCAPKGAPVPPVDEVTSSLRHPR